MLRINKTITSLILLLCFIATQNTLISMALPGQDIKVVVKELEKKGYVNKFSASTYDYKKVYQGTTIDKMYNLILEDQSGKSHSEKIIGVTNNKQQLFDKADGTTVNLLNKIYGATTAKDFQNSKLISSFKVKTNTPEICKIYKSDKYVYVINQKKSITLYSINDLQKIIDLFK